MIEGKEIERLKRHLVAITAKADDAEALAEIVSLQGEFAKIIAAQARKCLADLLPGKHEARRPWKPHALHLAA